ncbi:glycosyl transferase [Virgisporangium aliadipatigenens]|uniref:Glycosyl transferase n=1 Tax=Virgisporangium aliadipatigenens TaxID=741659 RepID=A0A8J3YXE7_9ACTN|nr:glycosyltransferase family 4 protein [Virgisporangium aliadipatigenens]GIJ51500.1 glycosyl transferase [Virgisporangium aliadipatigenens]
MKVVVAHNRYVSAQPSGENTIVDAEIAQLTAAGVTVLPLIRSSDDIGSLPKAQKALLPFSPMRNPGAVSELRRLIRQEKPDVLHLHNPYPLISPAVITEARRHGLPVVHTVHNFRQVCVAGTYFRDGHVCTDCKGRAFPTPAVRHSCYRGSKAQSVVMATTLSVHRRTWLDVPHYVALTGTIAAHLREFGVPQERITVKPNGVPDPGPPTPPGDGFLFAGRLTVEKGLRLLLDAWLSHPEGSLGTLRIAGDGPLRGEIPARGDVVYLGQLDRAGMEAALRRTAALIVPSIWPDVLPTSIIEGLAHGRPTLGTDLGGIPFVIGDTGWAVPPAELADALPRAAKEAPSRAEAARRRYESEFTPEVNVTRLLALYESVAR